MGRGRGLSVSLQYVHSFRDRHGYQRYYYRRSGFPRATLPGKPGSAEFMTAYNQANAYERPTPAQKPKAASGTVEWAVSLYLGSDIPGARRRDDPDPA